MPPVCSRLPPGPPVSLAPSHTPPEFLVAPGLRPMPHPPAACTVHRAKIPRGLMSHNNRSKFNVALGIEAQGFCVLEQLRPNARC